MTHSRQHSGRQHHQGGDFGGAVDFLSTGGDIGRHHQCGRAGQQNDRGGLDAEGPEPACDAGQSAHQGKSANAGKVRSRAASVAGPLAFQADRGAPQRSYGDANYALLFEAHGEDDWPDAPARFQSYSITDESELLWSQSAGAKQPQIPLTPDSNGETQPRSSVLPSPDSSDVHMNKFRFRIISHPAAVEAESNVAQFRSGYPGNADVNGFPLHVQAV